jgi:hypothetical protein
MTEPLKMYELAIDREMCHISDTTVTLMLSADGLQAFEQWVAGLRLELPEMHVPPAGSG